MASDTAEKQEKRLSKRVQRREDRRLILTKKEASKDRLDKFDIRSEKVDAKKDDATTKLTNKEQAQKDYSNWFNSQTNPTEALIKAKKDQLGL